MNDEIKEILGYLAFLEDIDTQKKVKQVADYITTLQEENKQLKVKSEVLEENNKLLIQQKAQMYEDLDIAYEKIDKAIDILKGEK